MQQASGRTLTELSTPVLLPWPDSPSLQRHFVGHGLHIAYYSQVTLMHGLVYAFRG